MKKIGESQVISFFSFFLRDAHNKMSGSHQHLAIGDFAGMQDRKFADFFAGTRATNILIEFKEFKSECAAEKTKPLRAKLCKELDHDVAALSRQCHFIGWREQQIDDLTVELNPYIDSVCPLWKCNQYLLSPTNFTHIDFVQKFLDGNIGAPYDQFVSYIELLNKLDGGAEDSHDVPFTAVLYSQTSRVLKATIFHNLRELKELQKISQPHISRTSQSRGF